MNGVKMNKKVLAGLTGALLLVSLTACGAKKEPASTDPGFNVAKAEASFVGDVYSFDDPIDNTMSSTDLITAGYYACAQIDEVGVSGLVDRVTVNNGSDIEMRNATFVIIASAITNLCPEYSAEANDLNV